MTDQALCRYYLRTPTRTRGIWQRPPNPSSVIAPKRPATAPGSDAFLVGMTGLVGGWVTDSSGWGDGWAN